MKQEELDALKRANNRLYNLAAIAEEIENAKATLEEFILEAEDELYLADLTEKDWSDDTQEFLAILQQAQDDLENIAMWSVSSMDERLYYAQQELVS